MSVDHLLEYIAGDEGYIRFLLMERPYIRAALEATSPPFGYDDYIDRYSVSIGNNLHLDLIELEAWMSTLSPGDRKALNEWAERSESKYPFSKAHIRRVNALIAKYRERTVER